MSVEFSKYNEYEQICKIEPASILVYKFNLNSSKSQINSYIYKPYTRLSSFVVAVMHIHLALNDGEANKTTSV